jgi:hypothetical protein
MKTKKFLSLLGSLLSATLASLLNYRFKIMKCSLLLLVSLLALTGCAVKRIECRIASQPRGASISAPGENFDGNTPVIRRKLTEADRQAGYLVLKGVNARWNSGVNRTIDITVPLKAGERNYNFSFIRPPSGNLRADLQVEAQIAQKEAEEAAARARRARRLALAADLLNGLNAGVQVAQGMRPTTTTAAPATNNTLVKPVVPVPQAKGESAMKVWRRQWTNQKAPTFGID